MRSIRASVLSLLAMALFTIGCGGPMSVRNFARERPGGTIAVVSLSINDYNRALQGWNTTRTGDIMTSRAAQMVGMAEARLSQRFTVIPASSFVANPAYQQVPSVPYDVAVPIINGVPMLTFGPGRGDLVGARVTPDQAAMLCQATGAQYIAIIYSEWGVATGGFIPTSKALTKTVVSIYDQNGLQVAQQRLDARGERTLGAMGMVAVNDGTVDEWVNAYDRSLASMIE